MGYICDVCERDVPAAFEVRLRVPEDKTFEESCFICDACMSTPLDTFRRWMEDTFAMWTKASAEGIFAEGALRDEDAQLALTDAELRARLDEMQLALERIERSPILPQEILTNALGGLLRIKEAVDRIEQTLIPREELLRAIRDGASNE